MSQQSPLDSDPRGLDHRSELISRSVVFFRPQSDETRGNSVEKDVRGLLVVDRDEEVAEVGGVKDHLELS